MEAFLKSSTPGNPKMAEKPAGTLANVPSVDLTGENESQIRNQHRQVSLAGSSPSPSGVSSQTKWNSRVFRRQNQLAIVADDERQTKITHHFEFMDTLSHLKKQNKELSDALKAMNARMEPLKQQTDANKPKEGI